jgi:hypothetical protein
MLVMPQCSRFVRTFCCLNVFVALLGAVMMTPAPVQADEADRLYDFTDAFYLANGVNPAAISGRRQPVPPLAVEDDAFFPFQRDVRALLTLPAHDHSGNSWFFTVMGGGSTTLFTNNAAGRRARQIADSSIEYVFPRASAAPLSLTTRQAVILDMRNGYFSNNPLGLWIHVWVSYTPKAFNTAAGRKELAALAQRNGLDADGSPIIRTVGEIDRLFKLGLVTKTTRGLNDPLRYAICPVIKDPTDGGIAPDSFLAYDRHEDGTPVEPHFLQSFLSLQETGEWDDD